MSKKNPSIDIAQLNDHADLYDLPKFSDSDRNFFFNLNEVEEQELAKFRDAYKKVNFILLLGYFKAKPVTLDVTWNQAKNDIHYIYKRYFPKIPMDRKNIGKDAKSRIYAKIFNLTGFQKFEERFENDLSNHATNATLIRTEYKYVLRECVSFLNQQWIALPAQYRLQKIVNSAIKEEEQRLIDFFRSHDTGCLRQYVEQLLSPDTPSESLHTLKQQAKDYTYTELSREIDDLDKLKPIYQQILQLIKRANISDGNLNYYADLFSNYRTSQLKQFRVSKATIYIASFIIKRYQQINDNLTAGFYRYVKKQTSLAKTYANEKMVKEASRLGRQVKKVSDLLYLLSKPVDSSVSVNSLIKQIYDILPQDDMVAVADFMAEIDLDHKQYVWEYYTENYNTIKRNLRRLFLTLDFEIDDASPTLKLQTESAKIELAQYGAIKTINQKLIRASDRTFLLDDTSNEIDHKLFEIYLFQQLHSSLDKDTCFISDSNEYRPLNDYLIEASEQIQMKQNLSIPILNVDINELTKAMGDALKARMLDVGNNIKQGDNTYVVFSDRSKKVKWSMAVIGDEPKINNSIFEQFDPINIIDLMKVVNSETDFFSKFTHFQPKFQKSQPDLNDILACILGNGTNFGLYKIASISDRSFNALRTAQSSFLRLQTLREANDVISNETSRLPIFDFYFLDENNLHGSIDGQKFECKFTSLMARYSPKYFGQEKGVSAMTLVLNHIPANSKVISADEHESYYIFDLIHNNSTEIKPSIVSTDTAGANRFNFAILHFFGYRFAPRYKKFKDQFDRMFQISDDKKADSLISLKKPIDWELINQEWENIERLMLSLANHKTSQSTLVKKLNRFKSNTLTLKALAEYDRAIKADYLLHYVDSETLRKHIQTVLNRGEAFHSLRRVIAETNGKKFRGSHPVEVDLWNECARLIANCVIHYNARLLSKIKERCEKQSNKEYLEALRRISPVAWYHINFSGIYSFADAATMLNFEELATNVRLDA